MHRSPSSSHSIVEDVAEQEDIEVVANKTSTVEGHHENGNDTQLRVSPERTRAQVTPTALGGRTLGHVDRPSERTQNHPPIEATTDLSVAEGTPDADQVNRCEASGLYSVDSPSHSSRPRSAPRRLRRSPSKSRGPTPKPLNHYRVSKPNRNIAPPPGLQTIKAVLNTQPQSEEEKQLLEYLKLRQGSQKKLEDAEHRAAQAFDELQATRKTLEAIRNEKEELQAAKVTFENSLQQAESDKEVADNRSEQLELNLNAFRDKYYKIKCFAKNLHVGLVELRNQLNRRNDPFPEIYEIGAKNLKLWDSVNKKVTTTAAQIDAHRKLIGNFRGKLEKQNVENASLKAELNSKSCQLKEEKQRNERLETRQAQIDQSEEGRVARERKNCQTAVDWMGKVNWSLTQLRDRFVGTELDAASRQCLLILRQMVNEPQCTPLTTEALVTALAPLKEAFETSETSVSSKVGEIQEKICQSVNDNIQKSLGGISDSLDTTGKHVANIAVIHAGLENVSTCQKQHGELLGSLQKSSEAHMQGIRDAISACSKLETIVRTPQKNDEYSVLTLKWNSATSELKTTKQNLQALAEQKLAVDAQLEKAQAELQAEKDARAKDINALEQLRAELSAEHTSALDHEREQYQNAIDSLEAKIRKAESDLAVERIDLEQSRQQVKSLHTQAADLSTRLQESQSEADALRGQVALVSTLENRLLDRQAKLNSYKGIEHRYTSLSASLAEQTRLVSGKQEQVVRLESEIGSLRIQAVQLKDLQRSHTELERDRNTLSRRLSECEPVAAEVPGLQKELEASKDRVSKLESDIESNNDVQAELQTALEVARRSKESANDLERHLANVQRQLDSRARFETECKAKDQQISELQHQIADAVKAKTHLLEANKESQEKDQQISNLLSRLRQMEVESQNLQPLQALEGGPSQQSINTDLLEQAAASQDIPEDLSRPVNHPPALQCQQRKVADRSQPARCYPAVLRLDVEPNSSQASDLERIIIPESQEPEIELVKNAQVAANDDEDMSSLTDVENVYQSEEAPTTAPTAVNGLPANAMAAPTLNEFRTARMVLHMPTYAQRRPSSAMSEDLIGNHERHVANAQPTDHETASQLQRHLRSPQGATINPSQIENVPPESGQRSQTFLTPQRLRSGTRHGFSAQSMVQIEQSPDRVPGRPKPNTAMKRLNEEQDSPLAESKKQRRKLENMNVRPSPRTKASQTSPSVRPPATGYRSTSGIIGSHAPAPGKAAKASKSRSKTKERYNNAFNS
jgi:DNA repair exonuclease SbcCD ATPase subunit